MDEDEDDDDLDGDDEDTVWKFVMRVADQPIAVVFVLMHCRY